MYWLLHKVVNRNLKHWKMSMPIATYTPCNDSSYFATRVIRVFVRTFNSIRSFRTFGKLNFHQNENPKNQYIIIAILLWLHQRRSQKKKLEGANSNFFYRYILNLLFIFHLMNMFCLTFALKYLQFSILQFVEVT